MKSVFFLVLVQNTLIYPNADTICFQPVCDRKLFPYLRLYRASGTDARSNLALITCLRYECETYSLVARERSTCVLIVIEVKLEGDLI